MTPDQKIEALGLTLPAPLSLPADIKIPFSWVRIVGNRAVVSGHIPVNNDGSVYHQLGKVGSTISIEQGYQAARQTGLAILGSLQRELGTLNTISAWVRAFGMVNTAPGFNQTFLVMNGFSDVILEVFGKEIGDHCRSAVGMAELPMNVPVEIEVEVALK